MPRRARITLPGVAHHLIQRGNNRQTCFYAAKDYQLYLTWLQQYAAESNCRVHAYVLMTNHVHLLVTPMSLDGVGTLMKRLGQRYVQYINRTYQRSGSLWEGRFRSCLVQSDRYALTCYRYIELNPVRASLVMHPSEYRWSSFRANANGEPSALLSPHETYMSLAGTSEKRNFAYHQLFHETLESDLVNQFRTATNGNYVIGCNRFKKNIESTLGRRATPGRSGRPSRK